jgi:hypothetical protein
MTFEKWILSKIKEDNAIGDLARDFKSACTIDKDIKGIKLNKDHLLSWRAHSIVFDTLKIARRQYKKECLK